MLPRVKSVRHLHDYLLELEFTDGTVATLNFAARIGPRGGVIQELKNVAVFSQVKVDDEAGTLVWPNGVDFCPDVLYAEATGRSLTELGGDLEVA